METVYNITAHERDLVQRSWQKIVVAKLDLPTVFYSRLFELNPRFQSLFRGDLRSQSRKLLAHFTYIIENLDHWPMLERQLHALGRRHEDYGVALDDYAAAWRAFMYAIGRVLPDEWTDELRNAYAVLYWKIVLAMIAAYRKPSRDV
jgi:hemoglobin-like flavoprotein